MARAFTAAMLAEIQKKTVAPILLYEGEFDGGTIHLWSGIGTISWNGNTYTGAGQLLNVSPVEETVEVRAAGVQIGLSGLPSALVSLALSSARQGKKGRLWLGFMSTTNGKAIKFDGVSQYMTASLPMSSSMTVEMWVSSPTATWNAFGWIASQRGANGFIMHPSPGGRQVAFYAIDSAGIIIASVNTTPADITIPHHYCGVIDDGAKTLALYVDGALAGGPLGYSATRSSGSQTVYFGSDSPPNQAGRYGNGTEDEIRIYARALSAAEVADHYRGNFSNNTGLVGYWPFEEGTGSTTADQSGNGINGTLFNSPSWVSGIGPMEQGRIILDPYLIFTGLLDVPAMDETGDTSNLTISYENRLVGLLTANDRRYTPEDQHVDFPGDTGFDFVAGLQDAQIVW